MHVARVRGCTCPPPTRKHTLKTSANLLLRLRAPSLEHALAAHQPPLRVPEAAVHRDVGNVARCRGETNSGRDPAEGDGLLRAPPAEEDVGDALAPAQEWDPVPQDAKSKNADPPLRAPSCN